MLGLVHLVKLKFYCVEHLNSPFILNLTIYYLHIKVHFFFPIPSSNVVNLCVIFHCFKAFIVTLRYSSIEDLCQKVNVHIFLLNRLFLHFLYLVIATNLQVQLLILRCGFYNYYYY